MCAIYPVDFIDRNGLFWYVWSGDLFVECSLPWIFVS